MSKMNRVVLGAVLGAAAISLVGCTSPHQNATNAGGLAEPQYTSGPSKMYPVPATNHRYTDVNFAFDSATIPSQFYHQLDMVATALKNHPKAHVTLIGFTDHTGSASYNKKLAARRANAVSKYLQSHGASASQIKVVGYGEVPTDNVARTQVGDHYDRAVRVQMTPAS